ncbi:unnamed protein product, partial [marine sediment metagenome]
LNIKTISVNTPRGKKTYFPIGDNSEDIMK